ncbi:MAG: ligase-associated DNA damage response endonuclease PdeM [Chloroflexaceae bacterium]|nr:ligase-associated DNA damage response endonuclease PdeM [Chloroflexaceae bacterium]NJL34453.1 ligase-associated DNA damage response endonuclease PdeM [Chloroflexaceae bacterium]NJO06719.1 ligase-associated DNA damage response endonuclease PdeM [Chloroflexaceae bacterium]
MIETIALELCGEQMLLLAEHALFWKRTRTLFVADTHWGSTEILFTSGHVDAGPGGNTAGDMERLDQAIARTNPRRLVFLGDLIHARGGRNPTTLALAQAWRNQHRDITMMLIRGNHDAVTGDPPESLRITCVDEPYNDPPFVYRHYPIPSRAGHTLAGHLHPAVRLTGPALNWHKFPCYLQRDTVSIMPAFGRFLRQATQMPTSTERVYVMVNGIIRGYR